MVSFPDAPRRSAAQSSTTSTSYAGPERRSGVRRRKLNRWSVLDAEDPCVAQLQGYDSPCRLIDFGRNNCGLLTPARLEKGQEIALILHLYGNSIELQGQVVNRGEVDGFYRYGVEFAGELPTAVQPPLPNQDGRRRIENLYEEAERYSKRLVVWKTREFYYYHRSDRDREGKEAINFASNDYLGLSSHPRVQEVVRLALEKYGLGTTGPSVFAGDFKPHQTLATELAEFKGMEACILCPSGFTANSGIFTGLVAKGKTLIFLDEKDHASIFHGARASGGSIKTFTHNDARDLERKLSRYDRCIPKVVCVDGLYSMDGDLAPLDTIYQVAQRYGATLWVDDAHSFGVYGEDGGGIESHFGLHGKIDIVTGSLGKAIGAFGGFVCASKAVVDYLNDLGREFVFTTTLPPAVCAGALEAVRIIRQEGVRLRNQLSANAQRLRDGLHQYGFPIGMTESHIIPIIWGNETKTHRFAHAMAEQGILVNAVVRPAVRRNEARIRLGVRADQTFEHIDEAIQKMVKIRATMGLSSNP